MPHSESRLQLTRGSTICRRQLEDKMMTAWADLIIKFLGSIFDSNQSREQCVVDVITVKPDYTVYDLMDWEKNPVSKLTESQLRTIISRG
jgi:hypothetical protein